MAAKCAIKASESLARSACSKDCIALRTAVHQKDRNSEPDDYREWHCASSHGMNYKPVTEPPQS